MSPERRALLDALTVERFTPWRPDLAPTTELDAHRHRETVDQPPRALRLVHDEEAVMTAPDWMEHAACLDANPEAFFPPGDNEHTADWTEARATCARCPVTADCLRYAIDTRDGHAFLAGLTPEQRRPLLPKEPPSMRLPIRHGTAAGYTQHGRRKEKACTACRRAHTIARRIRNERKESA